MVKALWEYSISVWKFRSGEVYGHTIEEGKEKERSNLQHRVEIEYGLYAEDPFLVSPQFATLFTKKTLQVRRDMDRDSLACWLRSVEEAKRHQSVFRQSLGKITKYFKPKQKSPNPPTSSGLATSTQLSDSEPTSQDQCSVISLADYDDQTMMMIPLLCLATWIQVECCLHS